MSDECMYTRRRFLGAAAATGVATGAAAGAAAFWADAMAQDFPARPITLYCPFGAGGTVDQYMRALSMAATRIFGQNVVVENKAGAGGTVASAYIAGVPPDGYRLAMTTGSTFRGPWLEPKIGFHPLRDFTYVIGNTSLEFCAVVNSSSPWKSFKDFMEAAKASPDGVQYAAGDPTTLVPVSMPGIQERYGGKFSHIPFKSGSDMSVALAGNHVPIVMDSLGSYLSLLKSGRLRLLAALGTTRFPAYPDVPTAVEQGYDVVCSSPMGLIGPKGIPAAVVMRLHDGLYKAMREPEVKSVLETLNQPEWYRDPAGFEAYAQQTYHEAEVLLRKARLI